MNWKRHVEIFKKDGAYSCFPSLLQLPGGRLVVTVTERERPSHSSVGTPRVFTSDDDGDSWDETRDTSLPPLWPGATGKFRCELADGRWLDMGAGGRGGHFDAPEVMPATARADWESKGYHTADHETDPSLFYLSGRDLHIGRSSDSGASWERSSIPAPDGLMVMVTFRGCVLRDGTILLPVGGPVIGELDNPDAPRLWRQFMARSTDNGDTWGIAPVCEDPSGAYTEELALLELEDGRLLAMTRAHRMRDPITGYLWQQWSEDAGLTWSYPVETQIWGYPAYLNLLRDGRILCTYGHRRVPSGIRAALSDDGGRSWNLDEERILRDDGGTPAQGWTAAELERFGDKKGRADLGYPWSVQLADGTVFTVYYFTEADGITHAAGTRWSLER